MLDDIHAVLRAVLVAQFVDADAEHASFEDARGRKNLRQVAHRRLVGGRAWTRLVLFASMRSSLLTEIGWLAYFVVVFVALVYLFVGLLVPHHFNDKIAVALAAIFSGLIMIGTRAWASARARGR